MLTLLVTTALASAPAVDVDALLTALDVTASERSALTESGGLFRYDKDGIGASQGLTPGSDGPYEAGVSMQIIDAPASEIWPHVEDCDSYVRFLPYVTASTRSNHVRTDTGGTWTCAMELTTKGFVTKYSVDLDYCEADGRATFAMSEGAGSGLRAAQGFWQTAPWPDDPDKTLLIYVFESRAAWWVPGFARRMAAERGLSDITRLIGQQVERASATADESP